MVVFCLDLNAGRARAVCGPIGSARPTMLDGPNRELPLALSLEGRRPEVGRAGTALCRLQPHLACVNFLPHLGRARTWNAGRHRLNAGTAMGLILKHLRPMCEQVSGLSLLLPAHLSRTQVGQLAQLLGERRWPPLIGSVTAPLAAAWTAHARQPWCGLAVVLDVDDHALTWTAVAADEPNAPRQLRIVTVRSCPRLGLNAWKDQVLNSVADRAIRQSRRDPRESAVAEQGLYEQLDAAFEAATRGQPSELAIQSPHWYQSLFVSSADLGLFCKRLLHGVVRSLQDLLNDVQADGPPAVVILTASAAQLPGITAALETYSSAATALTNLSADSVLKSAHELACRWLAEAAPCGHHDVALKLSKQSRAARHVEPVGEAGTLATGARGVQGTPAADAPGSLARKPSVDDFTLNVDDFNG